MARDDRRMHGSNKPGWDPGRGHERHEEPVRLGDPEPGDERPVLRGDSAVPERRPTSTLDPVQPSALGGNVATRSRTARQRADRRS